VIIVSKKHFHRHQDRTPGKEEPVAGGGVLGFEMGEGDASVLLRVGLLEGAFACRPSASCIVGLATLPLQGKNVPAMPSGCRHDSLDLDLGRSNNTLPHKCERSRVVVQPLVEWALGLVEVPLGAVGDEVVCVVLEPNNGGVIRTVVCIPLRVAVVPRISAVGGFDGGGECMAGLVLDACVPGTHIGDT
jgi:hypothetical protein